jgi:hypothetical protein
MSGGWIKWQKDLETDPRVLRMARKIAGRFALVDHDVTLQTDFCNAPPLQIGTSVTLVCGALVRMWSYADTHIRADDVLEVGPEELNQIVDLPGFAAICPADWLEIVDDENVKLPDYQEHNGVVAKRKAMTAKRVQRHRNAGVTPEPLPDQDQDQDQDQTIDPPSVDRVTKTEKHKRASKRCPKDFEITDDMKTWSAKECPNVNLERQTAVFRDHEFKNARKDWPATWRNWMRRAQDEYRPGASGRNGAPPVATNFAEKRYEGTPDEELPDCYKQEMQSHG